jgi:hypothetical protein
MDSYAPTPSRRLGWTVRSLIDRTCGEILEVSILMSNGALGLFTNLEQVAQPPEASGNASGRLLRLLKDGLGFSEDAVKQAISEVKRNGKRSRLSPRGND